MRRHEHVVDPVRLSSKNTHQGDRSGLANYHHVRCGSLEWRRRVRRRIPRPLGNRPAPPAPITASRHHSPNPIELTAGQSSRSAWYNAGHDLPPLSPTYHLGRQPLAPLLLRTMSNDRPRSLGSGTVSATRLHPHHRYLVSRLVGGERRHREAATQLGNSPRSSSFLQNETAYLHRAIPAIGQRNRWPRLLSRVSGLATSEYLDMVTVESRHPTRSRHHAVDQRLCRDDR